MASVCILSKSCHLFFSQRRINIKHLISVLNWSWMLSLLSTSLSNPTALSPSLPCYPQVVSHLDHSSSHPFGPSICWRHPVTHVHTMGTASKLKFLPDILNTSTSVHHPQNNILMLERYSRSHWMPAHIAWPCCPRVWWSNFAQSLATCLSESLFWWPEHMFPAGTICRQAGGLTPRGILQPVTNGSNWIDTPAPKHLRSRSQWLEQFSIPQTSHALFHSVFAHAVICAYNIYHFPSGLAAPIYNTAIYNMPMNQLLFLYWDGKLCEAMPLAVCLGHYSYHCFAWCTEHSIAQ